MITNSEILVNLLCVICFILSVWQKTVIFSALCFFVSAAAVFIGFMFIHANVLFFPLPVALILVSAFMAIAEAIMGDVL